MLDKLPRVGQGTFENLSEDKGHGLRQGRGAEQEGP